MANDELPIIQATYDLIKWYVPMLNRLPRDHKYGLGDRIVSSLYDLLVTLNDNTAYPAKLNGNMLAVLAPLPHFITAKLSPQNLPTTMDKIIPSMAGQAPMAKV